MSATPDNYQVVIVGSMTKRVFEQWVRDSRLELYPVPCTDGDLPTYALRAVAR